jgi:hypothetical protein
MRVSFSTLIICLLCGIVAGVSAAETAGWVTPLLFVVGGLVVGAIFEFVANLIAKVMFNLNRTDYYLLLAFYFVRFGAVALVHQLSGVLARSLGST